MAGGLEYLHPFQALRYSSYAQAINDYIYVFSDQSRIFFQKKRQGILRELAFRNRTAMCRNWLGFPEPDEALTKSIQRVTPLYVADCLRSAEQKQTVALIDVRRADLTGHVLAGSINLPAHTFYPSRSTIASMLKGKATIILYCASSRGRGPRCAGWLQEVLFECRSKTKVLILEGGAKAFTEAFCDNDDLVQRLPDEVKE